MLRCCTSSQLPGYFFLLLYLASALSVYEVAQITTSKIPRPYFIRYINQSMSIILFIFPLCAKLKHTKQTKNIDQKNMILSGSETGFLLYTFLGTFAHTGGGMLFYWSMTGITIPTLQTLIKLKAIWVFILSVIFLKQRISIWKCIAVFISFIGIFCYGMELYLRKISKNKQQENETYDTWWGCSLSLLTGILWAIGDIWINITHKKYFINSEFYGSLLYQALVGFWTIFLFSFVFFIQQPIFEIINSYEWKLIIILGFILTLTNASFFIALNFTSPVFMNYASFMLVPLSFIMDIFVHHYQITILAVFGALFIVSGFIMLEIMDEPIWMENVSKKLNYCWPSNDVEYMGSVPSSDHDSSTSNEFDSVNET